MTDEGVVSW